MFVFAGIAFFGKKKQKILESSLEREKKTFLRLHLECSTILMFDLLFEIFCWIVSSMSVIGMLSVVMKYGFEFTLNIMASCLEYFSYCLFSIEQDVFTLQVFCFSKIWAVNSEYPSSFVVILTNPLRTAYRVFTVFLIDLILLVWIGRSTRIVRKQWKYSWAEDVYARSRDSFTCSKFRLLDDGG